MSHGYFSTVDLCPQKWPETSWGFKLEVFGILFALDISCLLLCFPTLNECFFGTGKLKHRVEN